MLPVDGATETISISDGNSREIDAEYGLDVYLLSDT
jgi:hypothetical protein